MRWILYVMVVANLLTFAWFSQHQKSNPINQDLQDYATTDGVDTIRLLIEREPIMDVAARTQNLLESAGMCHIIGPFKDHEVADDAVVEMKHLGREGTVHFDKGKVKVGYWVYLKSMPDQEVENIVQVLKNNGIKDYYINKHNELSLGIYNGLQGAKIRQMSIAALGYSPLVGPLYRNQVRYWIDVAEMKSNMLTNEAWDSYLAEHPDIRRKSMKCDLIRA